MKRIQLVEIAHARSGDKGNMCNIALFAKKPEYYPILVEQVTTERVKEHFEGVCLGRVERYEVPNLHGLNFLLHDSLDGGGTISLAADPQGKTYSTALLRMRVEIAEPGD